AFMWQSSVSNSASSASNPATGSTQAPTATPISGPRMIELALDQTALSTLFTSQLGLNQGTITDMKVIPVPGDGFVLTLNLHTSTSIVCGSGTEMLVLLIKAPPIEGVAAQPTPTALCFKGPIDINKLFPS